MPTPPLLELSVRELAEFVLRKGDLGGSGFSSPLRALAGTKLHQKIQRNRPSSYQKEVRLEKRITCEGMEILLRGRVDGLISEPEHLWLEEIKTIQSGFPLDPDPVHWGQAKIYAAMHGEIVPFQSATLQLTYVHLRSGEIREFHQQYTFFELRDFLDTVLSSYVQWLVDFEAWKKVRDASLEILVFPHGQYRQGQRELSVKVYHTILADKRLMINAPTGIGKTISSLFPALKAMGKGHGSKIFYLTSRSLGRQVAEKALKDLRQQGLKIRSVTLTAKNKICFNVQGSGCDALNCPFAIGYYDRIPAAVRELLNFEDISRPQIESVALTHQVCPYELSLDASLWSDVIIGDYNYVFDPNVSLKRFFQDQPRPYVFLIDEAHNLGERCRGMFSASLKRSSFAQLKVHVPSAPSSCLRAAQAVARQFLILATENSFSDSEPVEINHVPDKLSESLLQFTKRVETFFVEKGLSPGTETLLELYFETLTFLRTLDEMDSHYRRWMEGSTENLRLVLDCVDPSFRINRILEQGKAAIFISATLLPLDYFARTLGTRPQDRSLSLGSPFDSNNLAVFTADNISADYKGRSLTYAQVAELIHVAVLAQKGNYLAFFPSYQYLKSVALELEKIPCFARLLVQTPQMTEAERDRFLQEFSPSAPNSLLGLAVMGGIFGEAIDLAGTRLIGAIIVSVGLPQICFERNLTRSLFSGDGLSGFDYAYTYPGFNRVLQAVGRVIRTETDQGIAVLIDRRFAESRYRKLIPAWWNDKRIDDAAQLKQGLKSFWRKSHSPDIPLDAPSAED